MNKEYAFRIILLSLLVIQSAISFSQTLEYTDCINSIDRQILIDLKSFEAKLIDAQILTDNPSSYYDIYLTFANGGDVWVERKYQDASVLDSIDLKEFEKCFIAYFDKHQDQKVIIQNIYAELNLLSTTRLQEVNKIIVNNLEAKDFDHKPWRDKTILFLYKTALPDSAYIDLLPPVPQK